MHQRRKYPSAPLLAPMIDLFVLNLMILLMGRPVFGINENTLPILQVAEPAVSSAGAAITGSRPEACLHVDGSVLWNKETVPVEKLAERIAQDTNEQQKVSLIVEIDAQGCGAIQSLLQLQVDAGRLGIGPRLQVLRRPLKTEDQQRLAQEGGPP